MTVIAVAVKHMLAAGMPAEAIVAAVEEMEIVGAVDKQADRRRAADRERKRIARLRMSADSADTPHPPLSDKETPPTPPKEINSPPLTPQTTPLGAGARDDFYALKSKLLDAVGEGNIQPHAALVVGPIVELIAAGVDLDLDVLPTIRARSARFTRPAGSWGYFIPPIREAYERRIGAARDLPKAKPIATTDDAWEKRLRYARLKRLWSEAEYGPPPGHPGCRVPRHLVEDGDGVGWSDIASGRGAA